MIKGSKHSKKSRLKISKSGLANPTKYWLGKNRSAETKRKISEKKKLQCFGPNNPFFGCRHSKKSLRKMSLSHKGSVAWNTGKKMPEQSGEAHPAWKGENAGYVSMHVWVARWKGKPNFCEMCGVTKAPRFEWANIDHKYRRVLEDYIRLCAKCHRKHDRK